VFVALFFVTIGVLIDPSVIIANLPLLGTIVALIMVGKFLIWTTVVRVFGYSLMTAILVGAGLTQIGEFSFVLVQAARTAGHVGTEVYNATLAASLITILLNAVLVRYAPQWLGRLPMLPALHPTGSLQLKPEAIDAPLVLCGFGRVGSAVGKALETFGLAYAVIERDPDIISALRARNIPSLYGAASHQQLLLKAGADRASVVIVALPEIESAILTVQRLRTMNATVPILARAHGRMEAERLIAAGATEVIQPEIEAAGTVIRHALAQLGLPKEQILDYLERFRQIGKVNG
jgi:CPA2 family monovalent cation:H+ antiporter-2